MFLLDGTEQYDSTIIYEARKVKCPYKDVERCFLWLLHSGRSVKRYCPWVDTSDGGMLLSEPGR